jgi:hypothetical protein
MAQHKKRPGRPGLVFHCNSFIGRPCGDISSAVVFICSMQSGQDLVLFQIDAGPVPALLLGAVERIVGMGDQGL